MLNKTNNNFPLVYKKGKSTLLNCLAGKCSIKGDFFLNGRINFSHTSACSSFIEQQVQLSINGQLTVGELLQYAFSFKNYRHNQLKDEVSSDELIESVIRELMLDKSILKRKFELCSGGEQKRVAIAQELLNVEKKPCLLFGDEVCTGLDTASALEVMSCLKKLTTRYDMTVIVSIHSPSSAILALFNRLYVLARGGVCVYAGRPDSLARYLQVELQVEAAKVAQYQQTAELLLKAACTGKQVGMGKMHFLNTVLFAGTTNPRILRLSQKTRQLENQALSARLSEVKHYPFGLPANHCTFSLSHLGTALSRSLRLLFIVDFRSLFLQLAIFIVSTFFLTSFFSADMVKQDGCYSSEKYNTSCQATLDRDALLNENLNYLNLLLLFIGFTTCCTSPAFFLPTMAIFRSEHRNGWYSLSVFYVTTFISSLLQMTVVSLSFAAFGYFFSGQHYVDQYTINWARLGSFLLIIWLSTLYMQSIGQLIGTLLLDRGFQVAIITGQVVYCFISLFNDFFFKIDQVQVPVLIGLSDVIALKYLTRYLLYVFYGMGRCDSETEFSLVLLRSSVDESAIAFYIGRILLNVAVIKVVNWLYLYVLFNCLNGDHLLLKLYQKLFISPETAVNIPDDSVCVNLFTVVRAIEVHRQNSEIKSDLSESEENSSKTEKQQPETLIAWRNLTLYNAGSIFELCPWKRAERGVILKNLNGQLSLGTLTGLTGVSGSGKTNLLKVLSGQLKNRLSTDATFHLSSHVKVNSCFINQEVADHLLPGLTCRQALVYASKLKNDGQKVDHDAVATKWLAELSLLDAADVKVEDLSGGEKKRCVLGLELTSATLPNLVLFDEICSGLDSHSAEMVITCLGAVARKHRLSIVVSMHQPHYEMLVQFDQIIVLARGGSSIYAGLPPLDVQTVDQLIERSYSPVESCSLTTSTTIAEQSVEGTEVLPKGILPNRRRFSVRSAIILSSRYYRYLRGYLWKDWLMYCIIYFTYIGVLRLFFDPQIARPTGCVDLSEDFNQTCTAQTAQSEVESQLLGDNFKYNFFLINMFLFIVLLQTALTFGQEMAVFFNEHQNGKS